MRPRLEAETPQGAPALVLARAGSDVDGVLQHGGRRNRLGTYSRSRRDRTC